MSTAPLSADLIAIKLSNTQKWNGPGSYGQLNISYSFVNALPGYYQNYDSATTPITTQYYDLIKIIDKGDPSKFGGLTLDQAAAVYSCMAAWHSVANITFDRLDDNSSAAVITIGNAAFKYTAYGVTGGVADSILGVDALPRGANSPYGDIWLNTAGTRGSVNLNLIAQGQNGYETILHELGHAIGLKHTFDTDNPEFGLPADYDTQRYSTMSYTVAGLYDDTNADFWYPSKPMLYDILAVQTLYGPNRSTNVGPNTYYFANGADAIQAIWDANGVDEIDASVYLSGTAFIRMTQSVTIDLRPGYFSYVGKHAGNQHPEQSDGANSPMQIAIAYQVGGQDNNWIENATGGDGDDYLLGNDTTNKLTGGAGKDVLEGGIGNDTLEGGAEDDTYIWKTGDGNDTLIDSDGKGKLLIYDAQGIVNTLGAASHLRAIA